MRNFKIGGTPNSERTKRINALADDKLYTIKKLKSELNKKGITYDHMPDQRRATLISRLVDGEENKAPPVPRIPVLGAVEIGATAAAPLSPPYQAISPLRPSPIIISQPNVEVVAVAQPKRASPKRASPKRASSSSDDEDQRRMGSPKTFRAKEDRKKVYLGEKVDPLRNIRKQLPSLPRGWLKAIGGPTTGSMTTRETRLAREANVDGTELGAIMETLDMGEDDVVPMDEVVPSRRSRTGNKRKNVKTKKKKGISRRDKRLGLQRQARVKAVWKSRTKKRKGGKRTRRRR